MLKYGYSVNDILVLSSDIIVYVKLYRYPETTVADMEFRFPIEGLNQGIVLSKIEDWVTDRIFFERSPILSEIRGMKGSNL